MADFGPFLRSTQTGYLFWCPGCDGAHHVRVGQPDRPCWDFNNSPAAPTFRPSVLVTWIEQPRTAPQEKRCHSFVTDGSIEFLSDCTHALAGQTVPLPPFSSAG